MLSIHCLEYNGIVPYSQSAEPSFELNRSTFATFADDIPQSLFLVLPDRDSINSNTPYTSLPLTIKIMDTMDDTTTDSLMSDVSDFGPHCRGVVDGRRKILCFSKTINSD
jgi:hypothetical protein